MSEHEETWILRRLGLLRQLAVATTFAADEDVWSRHATRYPSLRPEAMFGYGPRPHAGAPGWTAGQFGAEASGARIGAALSLACCQHIRQLDSETVEAGLFAARFSPWATTWLPHWLGPEVNAALLAGFRDQAVMLDWALQSGVSHAPVSTAQELLLLALLHAWAANLVVAGVVVARPALAGFLGVGSPLAARLWAPGAAAAQRDLAVLHARDEARLALHHWFTPVTTSATLRARDGVTFTPCSGVSGARRFTEGVQLGDLAALRPGSSAAATPQVAQGRDRTRRRPHTWTPTGDDRDGDELTVLVRNKQGTALWLVWQPLKDREPRWSRVRLVDVVVDDTGELMLVVRWAAMPLAVGIRHVCSLAW